MSGAPRPSLTPQDIELINAYGPYNHAVWTLGTLAISHEEQLSGRGAFIVNRIRTCLLRFFTLEELKSSSILDVGCYDGWILHQLSDLPFARMVGIEPRETNILKGQKIRELLGIPTRVEFRIGDLDSLGDEMFDVVICAGVLHHVESIPAALRRLRAACRKLLFLETICLSSRHITKALRKEMEMKDIVYHYKSRVCGLTGQKFESSYSDGSTTQLAVVSIPSVESLRMHLELRGFDAVDVVADPALYRAAVWRDKRSCNAVCLSAVVRPEPTPADAEESSWIRAYEEGLAKTVLKKASIQPLYDLYCLGKKYVYLPFACLHMWWYLRSPNWLAGFFRSLLPVWFKDRYEREIVTNLRFNPEDKLRLEYGKILAREGDDDGAIAVLKAVTQKVNADWRSVYRSFALLAEIFARKGWDAEAQRYASLCASCNPKFPHPDGAVPRPLAMSGPSTDGGGRVNRAAALSR